MSYINEKGEFQTMAFASMNEGAEMGTSQLKNHTPEGKRIIEKERNEMLNFYSNFEDLHNKEYQKLCNNYGL